MRRNVLHEKSLSFAIKIVELYKLLCDTKKEYVLSKQLLRSGTAIGALAREAKQAESKKDFIHKLAIALKEANETEYWLELLHASKYISTTEFNYINNHCTELLKLLTSIIRTTKTNNKLIEN
jgi:four helix bundle protein